MFEPFNVQLNIYDYKIKKCFTPSLKLQANTKS